MRPTESLKFGFERSCSSFWAHCLCSASQPFVLPTTEGKHQDLKYITSETVRTPLSPRLLSLASSVDLMTLSWPQMVAAVSEQFHHLVERIVIIDCRYPYEFEGGHIKVSAAVSWGRGLCFRRQVRPFVLTREL